MLGRRARLKSEHLVTRGRPLLRSLRFPLAKLRKVETSSFYVDCSHVVGDGGCGILANTPRLANASLPGELALVCHPNMLSLKFGPAAGKAALLHRPVLVVLAPTMVMHLNSRKHRASSCALLTSQLAPSHRTGL